MSTLLKKRGLIILSLNPTKASVREFFTEAHVPPIDEFKNAMSTVGSQGTLFIIYLIV